MKIVDSIIELIATNRISTTEVADALGKSGSLLGLKGFGTPKYVVGKVKVITPFGDSNYIMHQKAVDIEPNEIVFVQPINFSDVAVFGELLTKYCLLYKSAKALIVNGNIRDTARILKDDYAIWAQGSNPVGAVNHDTGNDLKGSQEILEIYEGSIAICDPGGVVFITKDKISDETLRSLKRIEALEDLWHYCLNTLKWSTFDIVVSKRYENEPDLIPLALRNALEGRE